MGSDGFEKVLMNRTRNAGSERNIFKFTRVKGASGEEQRSDERRKNSLMLVAQTH